MEGVSEKYVAGALAIIGVLAGSITNHLLNRRTKQRELLWQLKLEGYTAVVIAFQMFVFHARALAEAAQDPNGSSEDIAKARDAAIDQLKSLDEVHNKSYLCFSEKFIKETERIRDGIRRIAAKEQNQGYSFMKFANPALLDLVEKGGKRLEAIAKSELK